MKNDLLRILNDGRGKKRDEEEGGTGRKEGLGGRRGGESGKMKKSLEDASVASLGLVLHLHVEVGLFFILSKL